MTHERDVKNWQWIADHPELVRIITVRALAWLARGRSGHGGVQKIIEELRYETGLVADPCNFFKINNTLGPYLSRVVMKLDPRLEGFFKKRKRKPIYPISGARLNDPVDDVGRAVAACYADEYRGRRPLLELVG